MVHSFHEGLPDGVISDFDLGIFHDPEHLRLQAPSGWITFLCRNDRTEKICGVIYVHINGDQANSPARSPYGSFLFADEFSGESIKNFMRFVSDELQQRKIKSIAVKHQPDGYSSANSKIKECLIEEGYKVVLEETSALISISEASFEQHLHRSEKKKLRKCREQNFVFEEMPLSQLAKVYTFLEACREEKGYALSMSLTDLQKLAITFPQRLLLTVVADKNKIIAANISIVVYDHVLYNFYHDHSSEYDWVSPVVQLNEGLYMLCQQRKIKFLDLGTSNPNGTLNESLLTFKLRLGARPSSKFTFVKNFV